MFIWRLLMVSVVSFRGAMVVVWGEEMEDV